VIRIVTDSTADLSSDIVKDLNLTVAPVHVHFGSEVYQDGVDITPSEIYQKLDSAPVHPTTSQPNPEDILALYRNLGQEDEGIVSIHISSEISGTVNSARIAAGMYPDSPVEIIDSRFNSVGLGLVVQAAARVAKAGGKMAEVVAEARQAVSQVDMLGLFDTLKYVYRGGRISRAKFTVGSLIGIKPILNFKDGKLHQAGVVRSYTAGMVRLEKFVRSSRNISDLAIAHSAVPDKAEELKHKLGEFFEFERIQIHELGAALGVHGGPGVLLIGIRRAS